MNNRNQQKQPNENKQVCSRYLCLNCEKFQISSFSSCETVLRRWIGTDWISWLLVTLFCDKVFLFHKVVFWHFLLCSRNPISLPLQISENRFVNWDLRSHFLSCGTSWFLGLLLYSLDRERGNCLRKIDIFSQNSTSASSSRKKAGKRGILLKNLVVVI